MHIPLSHGKTALKSYRYLHTVGRAQCLRSIQSQDCISMLAQQGSPNPQSQSQSVILVTPTDPYSDPYRWACLKTLPLMPLINRRRSRTGSEPDPISNRFFAGLASFTAFIVAFIVTS
ncbi:unnamed protein product [Arctogadus glacialis]